MSTNTSDEPNFNMLLQIDTIKNKIYATLQAFYLLNYTTHSNF